ncbi:MAG: cytochrome c, partial [Bacteroidota bacterium]
MQRTQGFLFLIALFCTACQPSNRATIDETEMTTETEEQVEDEPLFEVNLTNLRAENTFGEPITTNVLYDPVFQKAKTYEAFALKPYLRQLVESQRLDTANTEIIFLCKDGYNPGMSLNKVLQHEPYLATKDLEAPEGKTWMDTLQGKWNPFYLIWPNQPEESKGFTWPYGLAYLQFKASDAAYAAATPKDSYHLAGFELYKNKCMKCHSMNQVGGIMGPEMNVPKNITEYWTTEDIKAFVKNPYSYRYNSKMPPVANLQDEELDQIIGYLSYMKNQKVAVE